MRLRRSTPQGDEAGRSGRQRRGLIHEAGGPWNWSVKQAAGIQIANLKLGFDMDERDYGIGAQILRNLGITKIRLITNNPKKRVGLMGYGLQIVDNVPIEVDPNPHNEKYLETKRDKLGHTILRRS